MFSLAGISAHGRVHLQVLHFQASRSIRDIGLAIIAILTSIVSVYYYLRVVYFLYMKEPVDAIVPTAGGAFAAGALAISMIGILLIGVFPTPLFQAALQAASILIHGR
jgi:NADH:ubiquinone oxidoreductase subunit 2 (subunit N)